MRVAVLVGDEVAEVARVAFRRVWARVRMSVGVEVPARRHGVGSGAIAPLVDGARGMAQF